MSLRGEMVSFLSGFFLDSLKREIAKYLPLLLKEIGAERLRFLIANRTVLTEIEELQPFRNKLLAMIGDNYDFVEKFNIEDFAEVIREVIEEKCPEFNFIPQWWIIKNLYSIKKSILKDVLGREQ